MEKALRLVRHLIIDHEHEAREVLKEIKECYTPNQLLYSGHSKIQDEILNGIQGREQNIAKKEN